MKKKLNLNTLGIPKLGMGESELVAPTDYSTQSLDGSVTVYFRNLRARLIEHIEKADVIFGCVAWLTDLEIIRALQKKCVMIVVQKEDFLRPPQNVVDKDWKDQLRTEYGKLSCSLELQSIDNRIGEHAFFFFDPADPITCVGNHNRDKEPACPRMHNKFLVFAKWSKATPSKTERYAVWTGSFNFTGNASASLENALCVTDTKIVEAYFREFGQIWMLSEELDWTTDWVAPSMDLDGLMSKK